MHFKLSAAGRRRGAQSSRWLPQRQRLQVGVPLAGFKAEGKHWRGTCAKTDANAEGDLFAAAKSPGARPGNANLHGATEEQLD